jgi:hypothetical protein
MKEPPKFHHLKKKMKKTQMLEGKFLHQIFQAVE